MPNFRVFQTAKKALQAIPDRIEAIVGKAFDTQDDIMIDMNIDQMQDGIRSTGTKIDPPYRPYTVSRKKKIGQPVDRVTLKDSGDFHNSVRIKDYAQKKELFAYDPKSEMLQEKYGPEILGLTDSNLSKVRRNVRPIIIADVKKEFTTKFRK